MKASTESVEASTEAFMSSIANNEQCRGPVALHQLKNALSLEKLEILYPKYQTSE